MSQARCKGYCVRIDSNHDRQSLGKMEFLQKELEEVRIVAIERYGLFEAMVTLHAGNAFMTMEAKRASWRVRLGHCRGAC